MATIRKETEWSMSNPKAAAELAEAEAALVAAQARVELARRAAAKPHPIYPACVEFDREARAQVAADITARSRTTIRQALEPFGLDRIDISRAYADMLDMPLLSYRFVTASAADGRAGELFVSCGGDALIAFTIDNVPHTTLYLVLDDSEERIWLSKARDLARMEPPIYNPSAALGPCPRRALRLVVSA